MLMAKILLVEDDKALREIYGVRLLAEGYDIVSAGDGEEALTVAIRERPALIISDVMMPKISGFEMLDLLRSNEATKNIKVIMMTALSGDQHRERSDSLGADRYLVKSQIGIEDVVNTVHEILGDRVTENQQSTPVVPNVPAPNQSPINPPAATAPSATAGVPAPTLPVTPPNVPVVTTPNVPTAPIATTAQTLPPVALPSSDVQQPQPVAITPPVQAPVAPTPANEVPSFQPQELNLNNEVENTVSPQKPSVDLAQSGAHIGTRVIQPTGESLVPKVDMENLIANEDAKEIMDQPISPEFQSQVAPEAIPPANLDAPEINIDSSGAINVNNLPNTPTPDANTTFPNQQQ